MAVAGLYVATFAARTDAYLDWYEASGCDHGATCECHWFAVREELTPERCLEALRHKKPISAYMEDAAGATHVGAIDFDRADGWEMGLKVAEKIHAAGGTPYLEHSRRGCHLWLVLDAQLPGGTVRLGLRAFVSMVNPFAAKDPKVELLPKKIEQRGPDTLGSPLRLPMMAHQRTGSRSPLCDWTGVPLGATITEVMLAVEFTPAAVLALAADEARLPISEVVIPDNLRRPAREGGNVVELLTAAGVVRAAPGRTVKCPVHGDQNASMSVSRDGERVWCKNPECPAYNGGRGLGADQLANLLVGGGVRG